APLNFSGQEPIVANRLFTGWSLVTAMAGLLLLAGLRADNPTLPVKAEPRLRRPVALALADNGQWLFTANRDSSTISVIDTATLRVTSEVTVSARKLADLVLTPDGRHLLTVGEAHNELFLFARRGGTLDEAGRAFLFPSPVNVQLAPDGKRCF